MLQRGLHPLFGQVVLGTGGRQDAEIAERVGDIIGVAVLPEVRQCLLIEALGVLFVTSLQARLPEAICTVASIPGSFPSRAASISSACNCSVYSQSPSRRVTSARWYLASSSSGAAARTVSK